MPTPEIQGLSEELYQQIHKLARVRGKPIGEVAAKFVAQGVAADEEAEQKLLAETRAEREEMARRGVFLTDQDIHEAKNWGRE